VNRLRLKGYDRSWRGQEIAKKFEVAEGRNRLGVGASSPLLSLLSPFFLFSLRPILS